MNYSWFNDILAKIDKTCLSVAGVIVEVYAIFDSRAKDFLEKYVKHVDEEKSDDDTE